MPQTPFTGTFTFGSPVVVCAPTDDLSALVVPAKVVLTGIDQSLPAAKTTLPIQSFSKAPGQPWHINLSVSFGNATLTAIPAKIHTSRTPLGFNQWDTNDTAHKAMLNDDNDLSDDLIRQLQNDSRTSAIQTPERSGAPYGYSVEVDDSVLFQAAITAAETGPAWQPAVVQINRTYRLATPNFVQMRKSNTVLYGVGPGATLIVDFPAGNGLTAAPTVTPTAGADTGLYDCQLRDFGIDFAQNMTGGAAIATEWTNNLLIENVRIGRRHLVNRYACYDALKLLSQGACIIRNVSICHHHAGMIFTGTNIGLNPGTEGPNYDGTVTGNCNIVGDYSAGSVGIHLAGGTGGLSLSNSNQSFAEVGVLTSTELSDGVFNRELFIGQDFFIDTNVFDGLVINPGSLAILKAAGLWSCGNGRQSYAPAGVTVPVGRGRGVAILASCEINLTGAHIYANGGDNVLLTTGTLTASGSKIYQAGENGAGSNIHFAPGGQYGAAVINGCELSRAAEYGITASAMVPGLAVTGCNLGGNNTSNSVPGGLAAAGLSCDRTNSANIIKGNIGAPDSANLSFGASLASAYTLTSGTAATLPLVQQFAVGGAVFDSSGHQFVIPTTGVYSFTVSPYFLALTTGNLYEVKLCRNGAAFSTIMQGAAAANGDCGLSTGVEWRFNAGDVITIQAKVTNGGTAQILCNFAGVFQGV